MSDGEKKKRNKRYLTSAAVSVIILAFLIYDIYNAKLNAYSTQTALETTFVQTVDVKAYIIRDEEYITTTSPGTAVPLVGEGERVAIGDPIAVMCGNSEDVSAYAQIKDIEKSIARYTQLNSQKNLNTVNIEGFQNDIYNIFNDLLATVDSGDLSNVSECSENFRDKVTARQISISGVINFNKKIEELNGQLTALKSKVINANEIKAQTAGFFLGTTDGYEKALDFDKVEGIDAKTLEEAFSKTYSVPQGTVGRAVNGFNWYVAMVMENNVATQLKIGKKMQINFPQSAVGSVNAKIESIKSSNDGKSTVVLSCTNTNEDILNLRIENAQLVMKVYTGYKIDSSAIRVSKETVETDEGDETTAQPQEQEYKGVYIKLGNIVRFRKVDVIYSGSDYIITELENNFDLGERSEYVGLYDEIIIGGTNLYDGKIIS